MAIERFGLPITPPSARGPVLRVSSASYHSIGILLERYPTAFSVDFWFSANGAIYIPLNLPNTVLLSHFLVMNGASISGNLDLGLYNVQRQRIVSSGSVAQTGTNALQTISVPPVLIMPGFYWMALAVDNTSAILWGWNTVVFDSNAIEARMWGIWKQESAFPLPQIATFANLTTRTAPYVGLMDAQFEGV